MTHQAGTHVNTGQTHQTERSGLQLGWPYQAVINSPTPPFSAPYSVVQFGNSVYIIYSAHNNIMIASTDNYLVNWSSPQAISTASGAISTSVPPSVAVLNGIMYIAYSDSNKNLMIAYSSTPSDSASWRIVAIQNQSTKSAPSLVTYSNTLYIAYQANNSTNTLLLTYSNTPTDSNSWTFHAIPNQTTNSAPSLCVFLGTLFIYYQGNYSSNTLWLTYSSIPTAQTASWKVTPIKEQYNTSNNNLSSGTPALAIINNGLSIFFQGTDSNHYFNVYNFQKCTANLLLVGD